MTYAQRSNFQRLRARLVVLIQRIRVHPRAHVAAVVGTALIEHDEALRVLNGQEPKGDLVEQSETP